MKTSQDYIKKDINHTAYYRKKSDIAETEMPGLMALPEECSLHMTIQAAMLTNTLNTLGADD